MDFSSFPGGDLVEAGLSDLAAGLDTEAALLVAIAAPRLRQLGVIVPASAVNPEDRLFERLTAVHGDGAHSRYNALIRRMVSFQRALTCAS